jgi:hypothetical protein
MTPRRVLAPLSLALAAGLVFTSLAFAQDNEEFPEPEASSHDEAEHEDAEAEHEDAEEAEHEEAEHEDAEHEEAEQAPEAPTVRDPYDRMLAGSAILGVDTPFGIGGLAVEFSPIRYVAIYGGGGVGRDGARIALGVRPQLPIGAGALGLMLGVTGGPMDWDSGGQIAIHRYWEFALFFHVAVTVEYRFPEGFFGRLAIGVESLLADNHPTVCYFREDMSPCGVAGDALGKPIRAWAGLSFGYALDL